MGRTGDNLSGMRSSHLLRGVGLVVLMTLLGAAPKDAKEAGWVNLFPDEGPPKGFHVTAWDDVSKPPPDGAKWLVKDGVLHGSEPRGTWLVSDKVYKDFELELDFKMGPKYRGNDFVPENERTGALYQLVAPKVQVLRLEDWNHYWVTVKGSKVKIYLNGHLVQDMNMDEEKGVPKRGKAPAERPRAGHIGFQELSRGGGHVEIRNARIREIE